MSTIMVVDDMSIFRDPIAASLRLAGFSTVTAVNGQEALVKLKAQCPDLILLDMAMPVMDGLTFLRALRSDPATRQVPVILLTAMSDRPHVLQAVKLGIHDYLLKSRFSLKDLLERVNKHLPAAAARNGAVAPAPPPPAPAKAAAAVVSPPLASAAPAAAERTPVAQSPGAAAPGAIPQLLTAEQCAQRAKSALAAKALSGVVAQVIGMAASPRGDMAKLAEMISMDPALAARVLQAANSAAYASGRGGVTTVPDAVRNIGCSTIRNIALSFGIFDAMPESADSDFNPIRCWQHSFGVARLCEHLAGGDEASAAAYLVGLCHDLGEILFHTHFVQEYRQVLEVQAASGRPRPELERLMLGMSHGELVMLILQSIGLPQSIQAPIQAFHAGPLGGGSGASAHLAGVLHLAEIAANGMMLASSPGSLVGCLSRSACRATTGQDNPSCPDTEVMRSEIFALAGLLGRLTHREHAKLMAPLYPRGRRRVCLVRHPSLSPFDPVQMALASLGEVFVRDALPTRKEELADCQAMVVLAATASARGFRAEDISKAAALREGGSMPVLWLTGRMDDPDKANPASVAPKLWPVPISQLAAFVQPPESQDSGEGPDAALRASQAAAA
jgi:CheY-like chemotaxis protein/HD-like signal output (HDOD) protein